MFAINVLGPRATVCACACDSRDVTGIFPPTTLPLNVTACSHGPLAHTHHAHQHMRGRPQHNSADIADTYGKWHAKPSLMRCTRPLPKLSVARAHRLQCHRLRGPAQQRFARQVRDVENSRGEAVAERVSGGGNTFRKPLAPPARAARDVDEVFTVCCCCSWPFGSRRLLHTAQQMV